MKIIVLASNYYPIQDASSIRIHSYSKALADAGNRVIVVIVYSRYLNEVKDGVFDGVEYRYLNKRKDEGSWYRKILNRVVGLVKLREIILDNVDCILSYHDSVVTNRFVRFFKQKDTPYVLDKTEYPYGFSDMSGVKKWKTFCNLRRFDGIITISNELFLFYRQIIDEVFLLPMTVAPNRFDGFSKRKSIWGDYIAVVFGTHNRDGILDSVISYNKYRRRCKTEPFKLLMIGDFETLRRKHPVVEEILNYINENSLNNWVIWTGRVSNSEIPQLLVDARCLLTTAREYTSGGFPTKLGEYLLSSVPVVATKAGEIELYLRSEYDIFLAEVGDLDRVADWLEFVQSYCAAASIVGQQGRKTALETFNASSYISSLTKFLKRLS